MTATPQAEARAITDVLRRKIPGKIDGKAAILELKEADYHWRQMEWIGWYFEFTAFTALAKEIGGRRGPSFGRTGFDYCRDFVWDLKAHPTTTGEGKPSNRAVLNDKEAIETCVAEHGGVGFIIAQGPAEYDTTGSFKRWHDGLKGGVSRYEKERVARGAPSRKRKISFRIETFEALYFRSRADLARGEKEGWLLRFQEGMRNANGSPRRAKYMVDTTRIPDWVCPIR